MSRIDRIALTVCAVFVPAVSLLALAPSARADEVVIRNDSLIDGDQGCIIGDFVPGEEAAVWLTMPSDGAIVAVQILWWSIDSEAEFTIERNIWIRQPAGRGFPRVGRNLLQLEAPKLTPFFLNEFRHVDEEQQIPINVPVTAGQTVVVSLEYASRTDIRRGSPSIVRDIDGCRSQKNALFVSPGRWMDWCAFPQVCGGQPGDFAIRVVLERGDINRTLSVDSDSPGSLVKVNDEPFFRETPFDLEDLQEGDLVRLKADRFSPKGKPFVHWKLDGRVETDQREMTVPMATGTDRTATVVYNPAVDRRVFIESNVPRARVDAGDGFRQTPFTVVGVFEGDRVDLRAFPVSPEGDPFVRWDIDGEPASNELTVSVDLNVGRDRTATVIYAGGGQACGDGAKLKTACKEGGVKVVAKLKKALPDTDVTFRVDDLRDQIKSTSGKGKVKAKWRGLDAGPHDVTVCDLSDSC